MVTYKYRRKALNSRNTYKNLSKKRSIYSHLPTFWGSWTGCKYRQYRRLYNDVFLAFDDGIEKEQMWWQKLQTGICKWPHLLAASGRRRGCRHCPTKPKSLLEHTANRIEVILLVFFGVRTETCFWFCCNSCCWIARDLIAQATHQSEWFF